MQVFLRFDQFSCFSFLSFQSGTEEQTGSCLKSLIGVIPCLKWHKKPRLNRPGLLIVSLFFDQVLKTFWLFQNNIPFQHFSAVGHFPGGIENQLGSFCQHGIIDFVSVLYFNEHGRFFDVFYKTPKNKKILLAHAGYILIRVVIVASFLATFHNLCQYNNVSIYNTFRELVGRPLYVIYGLILASFVYFTYRIWNMEYKLNNESENNLYR